MPVPDQQGAKQSWSTHSATNSPDNINSGEEQNERHPSREESRDLPINSDDHQHQHPPSSEGPTRAAYVAPIPKIGRITPVPHGIQISSPSDRSALSDTIGALLVGKLVDEDGDVVDDETGQVLAHTAGDLPAMVGRKVSNTRGDILGDGGELLGYVTDVVMKQEPATHPTPPCTPMPTAKQQPRSLFEIAARSSLMVDDEGNIVDTEGNVVGTFHDNNNPRHAKRRGTEAPKEPQPRGDETPRRSGQSMGSSETGTETPGDDIHDGNKDRTHHEFHHAVPPVTAEGQPRAQEYRRRTDDERRRNAEAWRKENPNESPSDIFLDVKSTREGIQLTIRIPTVFNGQAVTPKVVFE